MKTLAKRIDFVSPTDPNIDVIPNPPLTVYSPDIETMKADIAAGGSGVSQATTTTAGIVELATTAEAQAGTDTERVVTPSSMPFRVVGNALIGNDFAGNARGQYAVDIQTKRSGVVTYVASGDNSIAIGVAVAAEGTSAIAIGYYSAAYEPYGLAIGSSKSYSSGAIAIGSTSKAKQTNSIAIGNGATAGATIGTGSQNPIAIGVSSKAYQAESIAIGAAAVADGNAAVAIGPGVTNNNANQVHIGFNDTDKMILGAGGLLTVKDIRINKAVAVGASVASTHTLTININGSNYKILLSNV